MVEALKNEFADGLNIDLGIQLKCSKQIKADMEPNSFVAMCQRSRRSLYSGSPAFRRPSFHSARLSGRRKRTGVKVDTRRAGLIWRTCAIAR